MAKPPAANLRKTTPAVPGHCLCGAVRFAVGFPAVWAWHDHSRLSRHAHGAAYVTYVGVWRSKLEITDGEDNITRYADPASGKTRSFCTSCGTPLFYERSHSPKMVNIPRALFATRTGREPRYHVGIDEAPDWAYGGGRLVPLKAYPGVLWERPLRRKRPTTPVPDEANSDWPADGRQ